MKKLFLFIFVVVLFQSCTTYRVSPTNLYSINPGLTKQQFIIAYGVDQKKNGRTVIGSTPAFINNVEYGCGTAEAWFFKIYDCTTYPYLGCVEDHLEYFIFKNDILVERGMIGPSGHGKHYGPECN